MKLLIAVLIFSLFGCTSYSLSSHDHNPLEGAVTTITPDSSEQDENMVAIQAEIKRIVNGQGIEDAYLYWIINGSQKKDNMAVYDITITVKDLRARYIFGLTDGVVKMVRQIEVDAEVNCQHEGEEYGGRDQA